MFYAPPSPTRVFEIIPEGSILVTSRFNHQARHGNSLFTVFDSVMNWLVLLYSFLSIQLFEESAKPKLFFEFS